MDKINSKPKNSNTTGIELDVIDDDDYFMQDDDYISIEPTGNSNSELNYNLLDKQDDRDDFNFKYEGILKSPFKLPKIRTKKKKRRTRRANTTSDYDDLNELLINDDDDETYNNYSRVPTTYQESDEETIDDELNDNLSDNDYYLMNQDEIPFVNLWSSFSKIFIKAILRSTKRYNTYEKETRKNCLISLLSILGTAFLYLLITLYIFFIDGFTMMNMHDVNNYTNRALIFTSFFLGLSASLGLIGVRFKFKPMLVLYLVTNIISSSFQYYSIKQIHNISVNAERDMSFVWWDVYTEDIINKFENEFNCCGFLDYTDNAVPNDICPEALVHKKVKIETIGPIPVVDQKKKFNKTFSKSFPEDYFTKEDLSKIKQVDIKSKKPSINDENNKSAMKDIGIDIDIDNENNIDRGSNYPKENNLKRRKDVVNNIPGGCSTEITTRVEKSLSRLCIFCWLLSISSPIAFIFSLIYCRTLELRKKSYEYF
ncbi:hypothetical protein BCR36DRAFT_339017 [Piromyces finnis]|uniref:Uncharacterized protein n=1 Tax=Piromyces finnis TaxID=1754191 RepID=A0A1Y1UUM7_9FUNG|nr:hypothetical protein BCR36DRAFT_339017 [Piromyces finnis]|eukprot:ORX41658.1 hypothetical protein BCR36DRAFT_339017 [Piromyces finnis]